MPKRKSKSPRFDRAIGKASRVGKARRKGRVVLEDSTLFDRVEGLSDVDAKVKKQIAEYRREQRKEE